MLKEISQYNIESNFDGMIFCDPEYGKFGAQPGDILHILHLGGIKESFKVFFGCIPTAQKTILNDMGRRFNKHLHQTHRSIFPKMNYSHGITNTKQKHVKEYIGM